MSAISGAAIAAILATEAGATVGSALISANAAKSASQTTAGTAQASLDFLKAQKAKQEAAAAPYLALGNFATTQLPFLAARSPFQTGAATGAAPPMSAGPAPAAPGPLPGVPTGPSAQMLSAPQPPAGGTAPLAQLNAPSPTTGATITLRAPDGSTRNFHPDDPMVGKAMAMGAVQV
jgi:hypothetical protein